MAMPDLVMPDLRGSLFNARRSTDPQPLGLAGCRSTMSFEWMPLTRRSKPMSWACWFLPVGTKLDIMERAVMREQAEKLRADRPAREGGEGSGQGTIAT